MPKQETTETPPTPPAPPAPTMDALVLALNIKEAIDRLALVVRERTIRMWPAEQINGTVIGHLLVGHAMVLNEVAFFMLPPSVRQVAIIGVAFGALAMFFAWIAPTMTRPTVWRIGSIVFTAASWGMALTWASRATP